MPSDNGPLLRTLAPALRELERRLRARLSAKRRDPRSEKGRGGEKGRSRWAPHHLKKKKPPTTHSVPLSYTCTGDNPRHSLIAQSIRITHQHSSAELSPGSRYYRSTLVQTPVTSRPHL